MTSQRYIALLRGINVGRAKRVAMADLRRLVDDLGYQDVRTILNSGNVVFSGAAVEPAVAAAAIEEQLVLKLGFGARVFVLDREILAAMLAENTLLPAATNHARLFVFLLPDAAAHAAATVLCERDWGAETFAVGRHAAYVWCPEGMLDSAPAAALGKQLGTTRPRATGTPCASCTPCARKRRRCRRAPSPGQLRGRHRPAQVSMHLANASHGMHPIQRASTDPSR